MSDAAPGCRLHRIATEKGVKKPGFAWEARLFALLNLPHSAAEDAHPAVRFASIAVADQVGGARQLMLLAANRR